MFETSLHYGWQYFCNLENHIWFMTSNSSHQPMMFIQMMQYVFLGEWMSLRCLLIIKNNWDVKNVKINKCVNILYAQKNCLTIKIQLSHMAKSWGLKKLLS